MIEYIFLRIEFRMSTDVFFITMFCQAYRLPPITMVVAVSLCGAPSFDYIFPKYFIAGNLPYDCKRYLTFTCI